MGLYELAVLIVLFFFFLPFVIAFVDILKNDFEGSNKIVWLLAVVFVPLIGSIAYFIIGRKQKVYKRV